MDLGETLELMEYLVGLNEVVEGEEQLELDLETARKRRRCWTKEWISKRGEMKNVYEELFVEDEAKFRQAFRMPPEIFQKLLCLVENDIRKEDTIMRKAIPPKIRLQITLRYLTSGANFRIMEEIFRVANPTISKIVSEITKVIWNKLSPTYVPDPITFSCEKWRKIAEDFYEKWNYPFCLGALDGKHIAVQNFANCGTRNRNYKQFFSVALLAIVDANYQFTYTNVGTPGSCNDASIWNGCNFKRLLENGTLLPDAGPVKFHLIGQCFLTSERLCAAGSNPPKQRMSSYGRACTGWCKRNAPLPPFPTFGIGGFSMN